MVCVAFHDRAMEILNEFDGEQDVAFRARARQKIIKGKRVVTHLNGGIALLAVFVFLYGQQFIERTVGAFDRRATDGLAPGQDAADEIWILQFGRSRASTWPTGTPSSGGGCGTTP
jgi:hypothetical protein